MLSGDKHFNLFDRSVSSKEKKFYNIDCWSHLLLHPWKVLPAAICEQSQVVNRFQVKNLETFRKSFFIKPIQFLYVYHTFHSYFSACRPWENFQVSINAISVFLWHLCCYKKLECSALTFFLV